jgi:hypothetical protein
LKERLGAGVLENSGDFAELRERGYNCGYRPNWLRLTFGFTRWGASLQPGAEVLNASAAVRNTNSTTPRVKVPLVKSLWKM